MCRVVDLSIKKMYECFHVFEKIAEKYALFIMNYQGIGTVFNEVLNVNYCSWCYLWRLSLLLSFNFVMLISLFSLFKSS